MCATANIADVWRKHFVLEENMLELDCTVLTPEEAFKTADTLINLKTGCARTKRLANTYGPIILSRMFWRPD